MGRTTLTAVTRTQGANEALKDGTVTPARWRLEFQEVPVLVDAFRRMVRGLEFDVAEMALTTYLSARAHGKAFTALPIFLVRGFHHGAIVRAAGSKLEPGDLEGRRVGVNRGYTVTTGVWARGVLQDEHGVDLDRVTWLPSGDEHVEEFQPPPNVERLGVGDVAALVVDGRLDAAVGVHPDRPGLEPMIAAPDEAGFESFQRTGVFPINHLVVVKDELLQAEPDVAAALFDAFAKAKARYIQRLRSARADLTPADRLYRQMMDLTGQDPLPYGLAPNLTTLAALIKHAVDQRIIDEALPIESLFAPATLDLVA